MYSIEFTQHFVPVFKNLPEGLQRSVKHTLQRFVETPEYAATHLTHIRGNHYTLAVTPTLRIVLLKEYEGSEEIYRVTNAAPYENYR